MGGGQVLGLAALLSVGPLPICIPAFCFLIRPPFLRPPCEVECFKGHVAAGGRDSSRVVGIRPSLNPINKAFIYVLDPI